MDSSGLEASRRTVLKLAVASGAATLGSILPPGPELAQQPEPARRLPEFTGPGPNPYWNSVGSIVQKAPKILLTDRPVQL